YEESLCNTLPLIPTLCNIIESHKVLSEKDECGASPLHHAAAGGYITLIQFITTVIDSQELNSSDEQGNAPLHWAVERNQAESCRALLDLGANPNILNIALMSPLHLAVNHGHNNLVELLLSYSATDKNLQGDLGNTPVILACSLNNCEALNILVCTRVIKNVLYSLLAGEDFGHRSELHINYLDKSSSSPLHLAVRGGNMEAISLCIATGAKVDQQQNDRSTPLHLACTQGATEVVKLMLSSFDQVEDIINLTDGACQTPLHRATIFDHVELAEYLISLGADLNCIDCKGNSPLLLATSCGAWRTVTLLLSKGANVDVRDRCGCNFLHLAILQPKGLKNLPQEVLQVPLISALLSCEDNEGCTPLHYACRLGIHDSVKNMLGLSGQIGLACKSKDKKSALHFAAQYGRINTCHRLLETITDSRLLNEGDERGLTPLHLASREGHTKVVQLLLRKGALFHSDYKGWTCLHHAASAGYTQTMDILLSANPKLMDKTDEDGNTALHVAAREGHVAAVKLMLTRGAELILNKNDTSFLHEALQNGRKDVVNAVIDSDKCAEALRLFNVGSTQGCPILEMIEFLPETYKVATDKEKMRIKQYIICYFSVLLFVKAMVHYNRIELLNHPVCKKYLAMKWCVFVIQHFSFCYVATDQIARKMIFSRWNYFKDFSNQSDWFTAILSLLFIIPIMLNVKGSLHWQAGAMAVLNSWVGFLFYIQRFERVGIYVVMFWEIMKTLVRIVMLFLYLMLAFGLAFHALMLNQFDSVPLSVIQTFVMMVGELNYQNNFLDAYLKNELPFGLLTYFIFVNFVLLMPILLVNLMIGLAVGDIAEVQRNAALKRIAMQIELHTALEDKLPYWFVKRVDKNSITVYPNRKCSKVSSIFKILYNILICLFWSRLQAKSQRCPAIENELTKQKYRMKEMSSTLEKQHNLLKLIIQKMEITSEADEYDGPMNVRGSMWPRLSQAKPRVHNVSRWVPLMKAIESKRK
uniref:Transient receptor potential cation channel, subfamily A, member 1b n=1 Tax=Dicentrarchus labrax TaxID=13489 RepID=A0A8C4GDH1_DICLA